VQRGRYPSDRGVPQLEPVIRFRRRVVEHAFVDPCEVNVVVQQPGHELAPAESWRDVQLAAPSQRHHEVGLVLHVVEGMVGEQVLRVEKQRRRVGSHLKPLLMRQHAALRQAGAARGELDADEVPALGLVAARLARRRQQVVELVRAWHDTASDDDV
jgi:hypothetical protein